LLAFGQEVMAIKRIKEKDSGETITFDELQND
jgi:hypothetical protein